MEQREKSEDKLLDSRYWMLDARYRMQHRRLQKAEDNLKKLYALC
jgi:hypothetical protein